jgi:hypothetical protein
MSKRKESPYVVRLERSVADIPYPPEGECGIGIDYVEDKFPGVKKLTINGPLKYQYGHESFIAWRHFIARLSDGQVVDPCLPPGRRVFPGLKHYMNHSGIRVLTMKRKGKGQNTSEDPVMIHRGPLRPFRVLNIRGRRARVTDDQTKAKTLPVRNVQSCDSVIKSNLHLRPGRKPSTDFPTLQTQKTQVRGQFKVALS